MLFARPRRTRLFAVVLGALAAACQVPAKDAPVPAEDTSPPVPEWPGNAPVVLPEGTVLRCAVAEDLAFSTARVGDVVTLIATEKLVMDGVTVVLPGTHLQARLSRLERSRSRLRAPELWLDTVSIESASGILRDCPARTIRVALESDQHGLPAGTLLDVFVSAPIPMPIEDHI